VLLHEDHRLPLVAVDLWYHVGPVNEAKGRTGFAHLFEHMMFEGSEHVGEKAHFRYLEGVGATDINGTTDFDRTNYFETVPSNELELALWLESDRMGFLLEKLDREKLTNQRDVVRNERRQGENQPYQLSQEQVYHLLFPQDHPYYGSVIGSHADIEAARLPDVRNFFHSYYTPNNANIAIAGDFDKSQLKQLVEKYFGPIPKGPEPPPVTVTTPPITTQKTATVTDTVQLPEVSYAWLMPPAFQPGDADAEMLMDILGGGKASRLYRKLVYEKQIAQSADCTLNSLRLGSVAECDVIARPGIKPEQLQQEIEVELRAIREQGPSQAELDGARNSHLTGLISGLQRLGGFGGVADRMDYYNYYTNDPGYLPKDVARFQHVSVASVRKLAQADLVDAKSVVVTTVQGEKVTHDVPRSPADTDATVKVENPYPSSFETEQDWRKSAPAPGPLPQVHLPVPKVFTLDNRLHVYLVEDHSLPVFNASVITLAGGDTNPANKPGLAGFTSRLLTEGTRDRSATEIADAADQLGAQLKSQAFVDNASTTIDALSNTTDASMDLLSDMTEHPAFAAQEVDRVRKQQLTAILQEADEPIAATLRVAAKALYGDSPYGYPAVGTTASVKSITREDLAGFWNSHYGPQTTALVLTGDITEQEARAQADKYFGVWKNTSASAVNSLPEPATPERKVILVDKPGSPQTVLLAFGLGVPRSTTDYPSIQIMNDVLGGLFSSRLNMNLRETHGYTYGAISRFSFDRFGGPMFAGAQVRTDVTAPAAKELFAELDRITSDPPTAAELKLAQDSQIRSVPGQFETAKGTSARIGQLFVFNLPNDYYAALPAQLAAVKPQQVTQAAVDHIHPKQMIVVAVGDRAKIEPGLKELNLGPIEYRDASGDPVK
ncbi:MAG TPA: pitrilysin family protein, partial [Acidobacteriaceae bacterium]|nr:pitrilysin family protein [Acidobacteriaceae bacterium]